MNIAHAIAALLSFVIASVHLFVGSRTDLRPILKTSAPEPPLSTICYSWHVNTITLFAFSGGFAVLTFSEENAVFSWFLFLVNLSFAILGFAVGAIRKQSLFTQLPQGFMFAAVTAVAAWGLLN